MTMMAKMDKGPRDQRIPRAALHHMKACSHGEKIVIPQVVLQGVQILATRQASHRLTLVVRNLLSRQRLLKH
jgi:hypothetical protein